MTTFAIAVLAAALAAAETVAPPTPAQPAPAGKEAMGGPFEPLALDPTEIIVEGRREPSLVPDPALERRYGPRRREPLNPITIRF